MLKIRWKYFYKSEIPKCVIILLILVVNLPEASPDCNTDDDEWPCDNGECINDIYLCDGKVNCSDGSDEIAENCIHRSCREPSFKCTYGGCIIGIGRCNGVRECVDNSDESPFLCSAESNIAQLQKQLQGKCQDDELQCDSGECIDKSARCNGVTNCKDGSDETAAKCSHMICPEYAFRCGYGACIMRSAKCNGRLDCVDGSDEAALLCGRPRKTNSTINTLIWTPSTTTEVTTLMYTPVRTTATTTKTTRKPVFIPNFFKPDNSVCVIPNTGEELIITNLRGNQLQLGDSVGRNEYVNLTCRRGFNLVGQSHIACGAGGRWSAGFSSCIKFCSATEITRGISTTVVCTLNKSIIPSLNEISPGTECAVSCTQGFEEPSPDSAIFRDKIRCTKNAKWDNEKVSCHAKCGEVVQDIIPFAKGGYSVVNITKVPWHVGIYSSFSEGTINRTCSGTVISPRYVISATHCFWNEPHGKLFSESLFKVVAGNIYSEYRIEDNAEQVQVRDVDSITPAENYNDIRYTNDIALIRLNESLVFTKFVRAICLEYRKEQAQLYVESDIGGIFTGWGSEGSERDKNGNYILQNVYVQTLSYKDCMNLIIEQDTQYQLPIDKFCTSSSFGGTACRGDSGGGFIFKKDNKYYLLGVISHAPLSTLDCARDGVVAITNVLYFRELIKPYLEDFYKN